MVSPKRQQDLSSSTTLTVSSTDGADKMRSHTSNMPFISSDQTPPSPESLQRVKQDQDQGHQVNTPLYSRSPSIAPSTSSLQENAGNYVGYIHSLAQGFRGELEEVDRFLEESIHSEHEVDIKVVEIECSPPSSQKINGNDEESITPHASTRVVGIDDADALLRYLDDDNDEHGNTVKVYLIQGVTPQTIAVMGAKFDIDPKFWDSHLSMCKREDSYNAPLTPRSSSCQVFPSSPRLNYEDVENALHMSLCRSYSPNEQLIDIDEGNGSVGQQQTISQSRCSVYLPSNPSTIIIAFSSPPYRSSLLNKILISPFFSPNLCPLRVSETKTIVRLFDILVSTLVSSWTQELMSASRRIKDACKTKWWSRGNACFTTEVARERRRASAATKAIRDLLVLVENYVDGAEEGLDGSVVRKEVSSVKRRVRAFEEVVWGWDIAVEEQVLGLLVKNGGGLKSSGIAWVCVGVLVVVCVILGVLLVLGI